MSIAKQKIKAVADQINGSDLRQSHKNDIQDILIAALLCAGCATNGVKQDDFPAGVPCVQARAEAVNWYRDTRHQEPSIRPTRVIVTPDPPDGYGGVTSGSGGGFLIRIWKDQNPFYGSLQHEFRHTMPDCLSEQAVR